MASVRMEALLSELICSYVGPGDDREMKKLRDATFVRPGGGETNANGLLIDEAASVHMGIFYVTVGNALSFSYCLMMVELGRVVTLSASWE